MAAPGTVVNLDRIDLNVSDGEMYIPPDFTDDFAAIPTFDGTVQGVSDDINDPRGSSQTPSYEDIRAQNIADGAETDADGTVLESTTGDTDGTVQQSTDLDDFASLQAARDAQLSGAGDEAAAQNLILQRQKEAAAAGGGNSGCVSGSNGAGGSGNYRDLGFTDFNGIAGTGAADPKGLVVSPELLAYLTPSELEYAQAYGSRGTSHPGLNFESQVAGQPTWKKGELAGQPVRDQPPGSGVYNVQPGAMARLIIMKNVLGGTLTVNSAWRSPDHNKNVGGAAKSNHKRGVAFDIRGNASDRAKIIKVASALGFMEIISYPNSSFVHVALSPKRSGWSSGGVDPREVTNALNAHKLDAFRKAGLGVGAGALADKAAGLGTGAR